jgi:hypothetical protein
LLYKTWIPGYGGDVSTNVGFAVVNDWILSMTEPAVEPRNIWRMEVILFLGMSFDCATVTNSLSPAIMFLNSRPNVVLTSSMLGILD